jgi:hypothetical protein
MEINQYILEKALDSGICREWGLIIQKTRSVDELLKMYVKGIDFCLKNDFPSNSDLQEKAGDLINAHGIYIDAEVNLVNSPFTVLLGACTANLSYSDYSVSTCYFKHESTGNIKAAGNSIVVIDCFENSVLNIDASENSDVLITIYGNAQVSHTASETAKVKIIHKHKLTY